MKAKEMINILRSIKQQHKIKPSEFLLLFEILSTKENLSLDKYANLTNMGIATIKRSIKSLKEKGIIKIDNNQRFMSPTGSFPNKYIINVKEK